MVVRARIPSATVAHFRQAQSAEGGAGIESQICQTTYVHLIPVKARSIGLQSFFHVLYSHQKSTRDGLYHEYMVH